MLLRVAYNISIKQWLKTINVKTIHHNQAVIIQELIKLVKSSPAGTIKCTVNVRVLPIPTFYL